MAGAGASSSIVQAVVNIAAASDMTTTAEGVETEQQRNLLYILGCTEMQGFLFSPAIPAAEIRRLLLSHRGTADVGGLKRRARLAIQFCTTRNRAGWNAMNRDSAS